MKMKNKKDYKKFEPTKTGYDALVKYDRELSEVGREVVFDYMNQYWEQEDHNTKMMIAIESAANWSGFKVKISKQLTPNGQVVWTKTFNHDVNDEDFYRSLLMRMRSEIDLIEYDSHDEFGLLDEIVKVCNILSKYKHIIVLKRKKKTLLEKIIGS